MTTTSTLEQIKQEIQSAAFAKDAQVLDSCVETLSGFDSNAARNWMLLAEGIVKRLRSDNPAALEKLQQVRSIFEQTGDLRGAANAGFSIGIIHTITGDLPMALEDYERARLSFETLGDVMGAACAHGNMGIVHQYTGSYPAAMDHFQQARAIFDELGDRSRVVTATANIGVLHNNMGNFSAAMECYQEALRFNQESGDMWSIAAALINIGFVHRHTESHSAALEHFRQAHSIFKDLGDLNGMALATGSSIGVLVKQGSFDEARRILADLDHMVVENPVVLIAREYARARIQADDGDLDLAVATLEAALDLARKHDMPSNQADIYKELRDLAQQRNDLAAYIEHNDAFTRINEEIRGAEQQRLLTIQVKDKELEAMSREHERERAVLYSTLPKHVADRVVRGEQVTDNFESASVLFMDIAGFTKLSSRIPAGHVVHLLEAIFSACDEVCERHGVTKVKTIGDSYMAVGGVPEALEDHAQRTAMAAVDMLGALETLEVEMPEELGDKSWVKDIGEISVRIGVHCGPVVAGIVGKERLQYDVWGDTVNVASRMESTGEPGRVQVSEAFAESLGDSEEWKTEARTIEVKGKGEMRSYWLERG